VIKNIFWIFCHIYRWSTCLGHTQGGSSYCGRAARAWKWCCGGTTTSWLHTVKNDLKSLTLRLNSAWCNASDRAYWSEVVSKAMLTMSTNEECILTQQLLWQAQAEYLKNTFQKSEVVSSIESLLHLTASEVKHYCLI